jgi:hypothetical protein
LVSASPSSAASSGAHFEKKRFDVLGIHFFANLDRNLVMLAKKITKGSGRKDGEKENNSQASRNKKKRN